jgi:hypothetical protein
MSFHGRSGSFAEEEEGSIFGPPVHKFDNGEVYFNLMTWLLILNRFRAKTLDHNPYAYSV